MNWLLKACSIPLLLLCSTVSQSSCSTYYLDNSLQCTPYGAIQYLDSSSTTAYISAWTSTVNRIPIGSSCYMSISSYNTIGLKFRFSSIPDFIGSGGAVLNIYEGLTTSGEKLATYTDGSDLSTSYQYTDSWFITVELQNYQSSTNFDFELIVQTYDHKSAAYTGMIIGLTLGGVGFIICVSAVLFSVVKRIKRRRLLRKDLIVTPTGQPSYGSVTTTTTSNYPPPPSYPGPPPAVSTGYPGPPPAGSTGYSQAPPPVSYPSALPK